jgi:hypothetical protein
MNPKKLIKTIKKEIGPKIKNRLENRILILEMIFNRKNTAVKVMKIPAIVSCPIVSGGRMGVPGAFPSKDVPQCGQKLIVSTSFSPQLLQ